MLQTDYVRGTKDSDVLETTQLPTVARTRLLNLAGPGTSLHRAHRIYVEIVGHAIPFLPQTPTWRAVAALDSLVSFRVEVLDVVDVVVSKLARFHANDIRDVEAMVERDLVPPRCSSIAFAPRWTPPRRRARRTPAEVRAQPAPGRARPPRRRGDGDRAAGLARRLSTPPRS